MGSIVHKAIFFNTVGGVSTYTVGVYDAYTFEVVSLEYSGVPIEPAPETITNFEYSHTVVNANTVNLLIQESGGSPPAAGIIQLIYKTAQQ